MPIQDDEKELAGYSSAITKGLFVDFNILAYVWPSELNSFRIHIISNEDLNSNSMPLMTLFQSPVPTTGPIVDIFLLCRNNHFTQLLPVASWPTDAIRNAADINSSRNQLHRIILHS